MKRFREIPDPEVVEVDAVQWDGTYEHAVAICDAHPLKLTFEHNHLVHHIKISSISSDSVKPGWWLVRNSHGTYLSCSDERFRAKYMPTPEWPPTIKPTG